MKSTCKVQYSLVEAFLFVLFLLCFQLLSCEDEFEVTVDNEGQFIV